MGDCSEICDSVEVSTSVKMEAMAPIPALPHNTEPLSHQVAGHRYGVGKTKLGFLQTNDGTILKPVQSPPRGQRELEFYQMVFDDNNRDDMQIRLRQLMPRYLGTWTTPETPGVVYMRLEDVAKAFKKPCIADIKIGPITYDPEATPEKITREKLKFPPALKCGYQVIGTRVYEKKTESYRNANKVYYRSLNEHTIATEGLRFFFPQDGCLRKDVIKALLTKLDNVEQWFLSQNEFMFFAASLLVIYEGDVSDACSPLTALNNHSTVDKPCNGDTAANNVPTHVDVRLIDYAHVFKTDKIDDNFLKGIYGVKKHLNLLLEC